MNKNGIHNVSLVSAAGKLFIFLTTIPWFGIPIFDSQPFPIIMAAIFLAVLYADGGFRLRIPKPVVAIGVLFLIAIPLGTFKGFAVDMLLFRGLANYLGLAIVMAAFYRYLKRFGFPLRILVISNIIWLLVGIVHLYYPDFLTQFVPARTSAERGVTSLAPEPSFFGIYLFFSSWLILFGVNYNPDKHVKWLLAANVLGIVLLSQSAMIVVYFFFAAGAFLLNHLNVRELFRFRNIAIFCISLGVVYLLYLRFLEGTRLEELVGSLLTQDFLLVIKADGSINKRVASLVLPLHGFLYNWGMPGGFHSYGRIAPEYIGYYEGFFYLGPGSNKFMSWNGSLFYELGILGVVIWLIVFKMLGNGTKQRFLELLLLFTILFSAVPLAFPFIPMLIAIMYYKNNYGLDFTPDYHYKINL